MDLLFDPEKSKQLDCGGCNPGLQRLRNCTGTGKPAKVDLNGNIYSQCPRALQLESVEARYLVRLYMSCREHNALPGLGGMIEQTEFSLQVFDFLDDCYSRAKLRAQEREKKKT